MRVLRTTLVAASSLLLRSAGLSLARFPQLRVNEPQVSEVDEVEAVNSTVASSKRLKILKPTRHIRHRRCRGSVVMSFPQFIETHGRQYKRRTKEYRQRRALYYERVKHVEEHNCDAKGPWQAHINHLADWTDTELLSLRGFRHSAGATGMSRLGNAAAFDAERNKKQWPDTVDWGNLTAIKEPRDQGQCGSCWAHSAETAMRAHAEINNRPHKFSVNQIIECTQNPHHCGGGGGCDGATGELAYEYVLQAGVAQEAEFRGKETDACPESARAPGAVATSAVITADGSEVHMLKGSDTNMRGRDIGMMGWTKFAVNKEEGLVRSLVELGPVSVAVSAGYDWNWYFQGVMTPSGCDPNYVISHAVVLYGYGAVKHPTEGNVRYWRIKNSWGSTWGEGGNLRLQRVDNEEKHCGWDKQPEVGSGCTGGPKQVWVCGSCGILYDIIVPHFGSPLAVTQPGA